MQHPRPTKVLAADTTQTTLITYPNYFLPVLDKKSMVVSNGFSLDIFQIIMYIGPIHSSSVHKSSQH